MSQQKANFSKKTEHPTMDQWYKAALAEVPPGLTQHQRAFIATAASEMFKSWQRAHREVGSPDQGGYCDSEAHRVLGVMMFG